MNIDCYIKLQILQLKLFHVNIITYDRHRTSNTKRTVWNELKSNR